MKKALNLKNPNGDTLAFVVDLIKELYGETMVAQAKKIKFPIQDFNNSKRPGSNTKKAKPIFEMLIKEYNVSLPMDERGCIDFVKTDVNIREFAEQKGYYRPGDNYSSTSALGLQKDQAGAVLFKDQNALIESLRMNISQSGALISLLTTNLQNTEKERDELRKEVTTLRNNKGILEKTEELKGRLELLKEQLEDIEALRNHQKLLIKKG